MSLDQHYADILTMGRSGVDIFPLQVGAHLEDVETFGKFLGGSPTNVAVAAARLGHRAGVITGVGDDPFGRFVTREMERLGVCSEHVVTVRDFHTPVTFCELFPPDSFPLYFYREPSAPDLELRERQVDWDAIEPEAAADALLERGVRLAIVKQGPKGTLAKTEDERVWVEAIPVDVLNGLGAGDAFGGALIHGLVEGWDLERTIRYASAAGAYVCARIECSTAMPTREQLDAFVETGVLPIPTFPPALPDTATSPSTLTPNEPDGRSRGFAFSPLIPAPPRS